MDNLLASLICGFCMIIMLLFAGSMIRKITYSFFIIIVFAIACFVANNLATFYAGARHSWGKVANPAAILEEAKVYRIVGQTEDSKTKKSILLLSRDEEKESEVIYAVWGRVSRDCSYVVLEGKNLKSADPETSQPSSSPSK